LTKKATDDGEARRLERLWSGDFGVAYADRNRVLSERRGIFWDRLLDTYPIRSVLEVGCGQGANLRPIARRLRPSDVWGVDLGAVALERTRENAPGVNVVMAQARRIPFRDRFVDLAFTCGVLIHQPEESLGQVMDEVVRCSARYILWIEYYAQQTEEIPYHGETGALFRRDYGRIYAERHPELRVVDGGYGEREIDFDRATWQLLERVPPAG
jgi:pseudaminic acid biosynthesis-associated methylase